jgi:hypothetical protein
VSFSPYDFIIQIEGADPDDLDRAWAAAATVFRDAGVSPAQAQYGYDLRAVWHSRGFDAESRPSDEELLWATVLDRAEAAAGDAVVQSGLPVYFGGTVVLSRAAVDKFLRSMFGEG